MAALAQPPSSLTWTVTFTSLLVSLVLSIACAYRLVSTHTRVIFCKLKLDYMPGQLSIPFWLLISLRIDVHALCVLGSVIILQLSQHTCYGLPQVNIWFIFPLPSNLYSNNNINFSSCFIEVLGFELRVSGLLVKCSVTWATPQPPFTLFFQ
jgi:hypothetical protein